jgi:periplasmic copper chaperone A
MKTPQQTRRGMLIALAGGGFALSNGLYASWAAAQSAQVTVSDAWSRATPPHAQTGVVYMTLTSAAGDRLIGVSTPVAQHAELHRTTNQNGIIRMRPVEGGLELPAGAPVSLKPGVYHIMLMGLKTSLQAGQSVPLRLTFAHASPVDVEATVRPLTAVSRSMSGMKMN